MGAALMPGVSGAGDDELDMVTEAEDMPPYEDVRGDNLCRSLREWLDYYGTKQLFRELCAQTKCQLRNFRYLGFPVKPAKSIWRGINITDDIIFLNPSDSNHSSLRRYQSQRPVRYNAFSRLYVQNRVKNLNQVPLFLSSHGKDHGKPKTKRWGEAARTS